MIEALWYGTIASFTFIGFISVVIYVVLCVYNSDKIGRIVLYVADSLSTHEAFDLIYSTYVKNVLLGRLISDEIVIVVNPESEIYRYIINLVDELNCVNFVVCTDILTSATREVDNETRNV